jgi:hypothetical protein
MHTTLEDHQAISDLMTGWMYRDLAQWDQLAGLFHPDGTIEVTWFEGPATDFIEGSQRMGQSDLRTKHFVGQPIIRFNGSRAIVETNAMIIGENVALDIGCVAHNRFYDLVEKRDGQWKIVRRQSIYDGAYFTFPYGVVEIDRDSVRRAPREYAALAWLLDQSGFPVQRVFATKGSELEQKMKQQGEAWLAS